MIRERLQTLGNTLGVKSQGRVPGHSESCSSQKPSLWDPSWLRGVCAPQKGPRVSQVWKKKPRIWPDGRQRPGRTDLCKWSISISLLGSSPLARLPTPFLSGWCASLPSFSLNQTNCFSMCCSTCCCVMSLIINLVPVFTVSASVINAFFQWGQRSRENWLLNSSPCWFGG